MPIKARPDTTTTITLAQGPQGIQGEQGPQGEKGDPGDPALVGVWQDWTPTSSAVTVGNGTISGRYVRDGNTVHAYMRFTLGSTSSISGTVVWSLPVAANPDVYTTIVPIGWLQANTGSIRVGQMYMQNDHVSTVPLFFNVGTSFVGGSFMNASTPASWASGHTFGFTVTYEAEAV